METVPNHFIFQLFKRVENKAARLSRLVFIYTLCEHKDFTFSKPPLYTTADQKWHSNESNTYLDRIQKELHQQFTALIQICFVGPRAVHRNCRWDVKTDCKETGAGIFSAIPHLSELIWLLQHTLSHNATMSYIKYATCLPLPGMWTTCPTPCGDAQSRRKACHQQP